jgi:anaerobic selenocysteine-containing dehydrogenase
MSQYTLWAAGVCGVPAEQITRIAHELGQQAMIGSKVVIDGVEVPYRPVAFGMHGTATKFHSSVQTNRAILLAFMILGAIEAAGSAHFWNKVVSDPAKVHEGWLKAVTKEEPDRLDLGGTKWFPLGSSGYHMFPVAAGAPDKYKLAYRPEDMALVVDFVNPVMTARPRDKVMATWKRFGFVAVVTPYLSATAEYAADVVCRAGRWTVGGR